MGGLPTIHTRTTEAMTAEIKQEIDVIGRRSERISSSGLIQFLTKFYPEKLPPEEAAELEMALNSRLDQKKIDEIVAHTDLRKTQKSTDSYSLTNESRPDREKFEAVTKVFDLLKDFINTKINSPTLIAITLYTDIFEAKITHNPRIFNISEHEHETNYGIDSTNVKTLKPFKEALLEISTKEPHYFIEKYIHTISPSEIQALEKSEYKPYSGLDRKLTFIIKNLPRSMTNWIEHIYVLLQETPINRDYAILIIIDLYYKSSPNKDAKQHIENALNDCKRVLNWDVKNLKKHIKKSNTFFQTANIIIKSKLGFFSRNLPDILLLEDLAHSLDLYSEYKYNADKRKHVLGAIEKAWKEHEKHNPRNQKKSIPYKKTSLWVSKICYQTLESQEFGKTQPDSIKHVMERFNASKPTPAKTKSPPPRFSLDKSKRKQLGVVLDIGTKKIIAALAKKLSMYNYQILEAAVEYCLTQQASNSTQRQPVNSEHSFPELDKRIAHPKNTKKALETSEHPTTDIKCDTSLNYAELPSEQPISPLTTAQEPTQELERSNHPKTAKKNKRKARINLNSSGRRGKGRKR